MILHVKYTAFYLAHSRWSRNSSNYYSYHPCPTLGWHRAGEEEEEENVAQNFPAQVGNGGRAGEKRALSAYWSPHVLPWTTLFILTLTLARMELTPFYRGETETPKGKLVA